MREYDPPKDRAAAHRILRKLHAGGSPPFTIHPGDWDWWTFHADPRMRWLQLIGPGALADIGFDIATIEAFGLTATDAWALGKEHFGEARFSIGIVSEQDTERIDELTRLGFVQRDEPWPVFERPTTGGVPAASLPSELTLRTVRGENEHELRAAAARRAFASTMDVDTHNARYLRFMRSPAYVAEHDVVAVVDTGRIASFAVYWPDDELSLAQFEPVGTDPDFQGRGIGRAVIAFALERLAQDGIERARVMTNASNTNAIRFYEACGFEIVDRVGWWRQRP
jgi:ribosomal protein S18 acetylase RimI-like enzyme